MDICPYSGHIDLNWMSKGIPLQCEGYPYGDSNY